MFLPAEILLFVWLFIIDTYGNAEFWHIEMRSMFWELEMNYSY